jgi:hypothetical protein
MYQGGFRNPGIFMLRKTNPRDKVVKAAVGDAMG